MWGLCERFRVGVGKGYLAVIPPIPGALDDPAHGSNDTEDACNPMTAIENADRLNDTRRSGTKVDVVGGSVRIYETIVNLPWDTEDPKNRRSE